VRSVGFGPIPDGVMISDPEPGVAGPDCLLWDGAGFDDSGALLTETIAVREFPVVLFGAGHVGAALVRVLANLPCRVVWVDERDETFPPMDGSPPNVTMDASGIPEAAVDEAPANSYFLVMTHNHALDLDARRAYSPARRFCVFRHDRLAYEEDAVRAPLASRGLDPMLHRAHDVPHRRTRH
jgi:xanthine dehydrogenase accessory factor